jgi:hypothetical protein
MAPLDDFNKAVADYLRKHLPHVLDLELDKIAGLDKKVREAVHSSVGKSLDDFFKT